VFLTGTGRDAPASCPARRPTAGVGTGAALVVALVAAGCGAKTGPEIPVCEVDADCDDGLLCNGPERCVEERCRRQPAVVCDDGDPCTADRCAEPDPATGFAGGCVADDLRVDEDEDGFDALQPDLGMACGPDCNDLDPEIFPGADERCNGIDDDCDLAVDEGATFEPEGVEQRVTRNPAIFNSPGDVAYSAATSSWGVLYLDDPPVGGGVQSVFFQRLDEAGRPEGGRERISLNEQSAFTGELVAAPEDELLGAVWWDERFGVFEIYFNRLTPSGLKLGADMAVSADDRLRSTRPSLAWSGSEWAVAWQDERDFGVAAEIYLTFLDAEGFEIGVDRRITSSSPGFDDEAPAIAWGDGFVGVAYGSTELPAPRPEPATRFVVVDTDGAVLAGPVTIDAPGDNAGARTIVWTGEAFLVSWERVIDRSAGYPDFDILGARIEVDEAAGELDVEGPLTLVGGPDVARTPGLIHRDGRVVLSFEDDREDLTPAVYVAVFDGRLVRQSEDVRATFGPAVSARPVPTFGDLTVGIAYEDQRSPGLREVFFTRLLCVDPGAVE